SKSQRRFLIWQKDGCSPGWRELFRLHVRCMHEVAHLGKCCGRHGKPRTSTTHWSHVRSTNRALPQHSHTPILMPLLTRSLSCNVTKSKSARFRSLNSLKNSSRVISRKTPSLSEAHGKPCS